MKQILIVILLMALVLSGCAAPKPESTPAPTPAATPEPTAAATPMASPDQPTEEMNITGVVKDATTNTMIIESDGKELTFDKTDVPADKIAEYKVGDTVKIYYTGEIVDDDATKVKITKIENVTKTSSANPTVYSISGVSKNQTDKQRRSMQEWRAAARDYAIAHNGLVFINDQPSSQSVYLTFDDGPDAKVTALVADILHEHEVKGNFFF